MKRHSVDARIREAYWDLKSLKDRNVGITNAHIHCYVNYLENGEATFTEEEQRLIQGAENALRKLRREDENDEDADS